MYLFNKLDSDTMLVSLYFRDEFAAYTKDEEDNHWLVFADGSDSIQATSFDGLMNILFRKVK